MKNKLVYKRLIAITLCLCMIFSNAFVDEIIGANNVSEVKASETLGERTSTVRKDLVFDSKGYEDAETWTVSATDGPRHDTWYQIGGDLSPINNPAEPDNKVLWYRHHWYALGTIVIGHDYRTNTVTSPINVEEGKTYEVTYKYKILNETKDSDLEIGVAVAKKDFMDGGVDTANISNDVYYLQNEIKIGANSTNATMTDWKTQTARIAIPKNSNYTDNLLILYMKGGNQGDSSTNNTIGGVLFDDIKVETIAEYDETILAFNDYESATPYATDGDGANENWQISGNVFPKTDKDNQDNVTMFYEHFYGAFGGITLKDDYQDPNPDTYIEAVAGKTYRITFDWKTSGNPAVSDFVMGVGIGNKGTGSGEATQGVMFGDTPEQKKVVVIPQGTGAEYAAWQNTTVYYTVPRDYEDTTYNRLMIYANGGGTGRTFGMYFDNITVAEVHNTSPIETSEDYEMSYNDYESAKTYANDGDGANDNYRISGNIYGKVDPEDSNNTVMYYEHNWTHAGALFLKDGYEDNQPNDYILAKANTTYKINFKWKTRGTVGGDNAFSMGVCLGTVGDGQNGLTETTLWGANPINKEVVSIPSGSGAEYANEWQEEEVYFTIPAGFDNSVYNRLAIYAIHGTSSFGMYFDDVRVTALAGVTVNYVVGDNSVSSYYTDGKIPATIPEGFESVNAEGGPLTFYNDSEYKNEFVATEYVRTGVYQTVTLYGKYDNFKYDKDTILFENDYRDASVKTAGDNGMPYITGGLLNAGGDLCVMTDPDDSNNKSVHYGHHQKAYGRLMLGDNYSDEVIDQYVEVKKGVVYKVDFRWKATGKVADWGNLTLGFGLSDGASLEGVEGDSGFLATLSQATQEIVLDAGKTCDTVWESRTVYYSVNDDTDITTRNKLVMYGVRGGPDAHIYIDDVKVTALAGVTVNYEVGNAKASVYYADGEIPATIPEEIELTDTYGGALVLYIDKECKKEFVASNYVRTGVYQKITLYGKYDVFKHDKDTVLFENDYSQAIAKPLEPTTQGGTQPWLYGDFLATSGDLCVMEDPADSSNKAVHYSHFQKGFGMLALGDNYSDDVIDQYIEVKPGVTYQVDFKWKAIGTTETNLKIGFGLHSNAGNAENNSAEEFLATLSQSRDIVVIPAETATNTEWQSKTAYLTVDTVTDLAKGNCLVLYAILGGYDAHIYIDDVKVTALAGVDADYIVGSELMSVYYPNGNLHYEPMTENGYSMKWYSDKAHKNTFMASEYDRTGVYDAIPLYGVKEYSNLALIKGDADLSGDVSATDLSTLRKMLVGSADIEKNRIDVNGDSKNTVSDIVRLKKLLNGTDLSSNVKIGTIAIDNFKIENNIPSKVITDRIALIKSLTGITDNGTNMISISLDESLATNSYLFKVEENGNLTIKGQNVDGVTAAVEMLLGYIKAGISIDETDNMEFAYTGAAFSILADATVAISEDFSEEAGETDMETKQSLLNAKGLVYTYYDATEKGYSLTNHNLSFVDGAMVLGVSDKTDDEGSMYRGTELYTKEKYSYGYFEIRAKLNVSQGICPAFWMVDKSFDSTVNQWENEIDVFECFGMYPNYVKGTLLNHNFTGSGDKTIHSFAYNSSQPVVDFETNQNYKNTYFNFNNNNDYHVFGLDWKKDSVTWYVDGVPYMTAKIPQTVTQNGTQYTCDWDDPMNIVFTCYAGNDIGGKVGTPNETTDWLNSSLQIDYLKVYQY